MKVKELIKKLSEFDGNLNVGGVGHYGEILEIYSVRKGNLRNYVEIEIEPPGDEPE
jgi:hypothetical protein